MSFTILVNFIIDRSVVIAFHVVLLKSCNGVSLQSQLLPLRPTAASPTLKTPSFVQHKIHDAV